MKTNTLLHLLLLTESGDDMQAIQAKFLKTTEHKPARVKIESWKKSKIESYDFGGFVPQADRMMTELAQELGWLEDGASLVFGDLPNGNRVACIYQPILKSQAVVK